jgi:hypothetical protein
MYFDVGALIHFCLEGLDVHSCDNLELIIIAVAINSRGSTSTDGHVHLRHNLGGLQLPIVSTRRALL